MKAPPRFLLSFLGRSRRFVSFASSGIVTSLGSLQGSRLLVSLVATMVALATAAKRTIDVLRFSSAEGSSSAVSS